MKLEHTTVKALYIYSATPPALSETIELAIGLINRASVGVILEGWKEVSVTGKPIVDEILKRIDSADMIVCDLTTMSMNVLFELGYAIAQEKRVWLTLDSSVPRAKQNFKRFDLLSAIGVADFDNSHELKNRFLHERPDHDLDTTIFSTFMAKLLNDTPSEGHVLYLKSKQTSDASILLTAELKKSLSSIVTDDPDEVEIQTLEWYARQTFNCSSLIAHLTDDGRANAEGGDELRVRNAKYALVTGLARGFGKPILMLAHAPFTSPVDFRQLLKVHETARQCVEYASPWINETAQRLKRYEQNHRKSRKRLRETIRLQRVSLGQYVAENEETSLGEYFVETAPYTEALKTTQYLIYVGRKGTGKTANLYQLREQLYADKRNHVCVIQPVDYELEGVLKLLTSNLSKAHPGYLPQSLWKFLVYTELAISVYDELINRPGYFPLSDSEKALIEYVQQNSRFITATFTERMEYAITELCRIDVTSRVTEERAKVSEALHDQIIANLRAKLGDVLQTKEKVVILIDNLDKAWRKRDDLEILAEFLFGLLGAGQTITSEFRKKGAVTWQPVNLILIIFLRSDIFSYVVTHAREADKVTSKRIDWTDPLLLHRVIEERFAVSLDLQVDNIESIWSDYFTPTVKGISTKSYIIGHIIPRPRDIIYFCLSALDHAINHTNVRIEEVDIIQAQENYSRHVFETLLTETKALFEKIENVLYEFAGREEVVTEADIRQIMKESGISPDDYERLLDLLYENTFLGLEVKPDTFEFLYDSSKRPVLEKLARDTAKSIGVKRYRINVPFHQYLEIKGTLDSSA